MIAKLKDACGFCAKSPFWSDTAILGFFALGASLGLVFGMIAVCQ